jgi:hypothetical protein
MSEHDHGAQKQDNVGENLQDELLSHQSYSYKDAAMLTCVCTCIHACSYMQAHMCVGSAHK